MNKKNLIVCIVLNAIIIFLCTLGLVVPYITFHGFTSIEMQVKLYEFDISILLMISSCIIIVFSSLVLAQKIKFIPRWVYILKLIMTAAMTMMMVTIILLSLIDTFTGQHPFDIASFYTNANLYFHLLVPIVSIVSFLFFEKSINKMKLIHTLYVLIPIILYFTLYISFAFTHEQDGTVPVFYDPYGFCLYKIWLIWPYCVGLTGFTYLFGGLLGLGNKKIQVIK